MNTVKYIFYVSILTISCNAFGMLGLDKQSIARKEAKLTILGLQYVSEKDQPRYFELLGRGNTKNKEFVALARHAYKYRRGLYEQEQHRITMKSSDPNRRQTL